MEITKYSNVVSSQYTGNVDSEYNWKDVTNAIGKSDLYAYSKFNVKSWKKDKNGKVVTDKNGKKIAVDNYKHPATLSCRDFRLNIPTDAKIVNVSFQIRIYADKDVDTPLPHAGFYVKDTRAGHIPDVPKGQSGWHNGIWWVWDGRNIPHSSHAYEYNLPDHEFYKAGYTVDDLNSPYFGIDLKFNNSKGEGYVYFVRARVVVTYDLPNLWIAYDTNTGAFNRRQVNTGEEYDVVATFHNGALADAGMREYSLNLPEGTFIQSIRAENSTFDSTNNKWIVDASAGKTAKLYMKLVTWIVGNTNISLVGAVYPPTTIKDFTYYVWANKGSSVGYDDIQVAQLNTAHVRNDTCFKVSILEAFAGEYTLTYDIGTTLESEYVSCTLDEVLTSEGVTLESVVDGKITFNIPILTKVRIEFTYCIKPLVEGLSELSVYSEAQGDTVIVPFNVYPPYEYHVGQTFPDDNINLAALILNPSVITINTHPLASVTTTGAYVFPCKSKDHDAIMIQSVCQLKVTKWEEIDYIGCVPLERSHYDPESTYKDTLLESDANQNKFMGKKLSPDEEISLKVKVRPWDVTTFHGLIDMDKPIPINANHECFEGDSLNHRGWAEIYGVKAKKTNPLYYDADIYVKYLTHNLNTKFLIEVGDKLYPYNVPEVMDYIMEQNEPLSSGDQSVDIFTVTTDGGYFYDDEDVITPNNFSIDNEQSLIIKSREPLETVSEVTFEWLSAKLTETRENKISRIISLIDSHTNQTVFEYEYYDFDFSDYNESTGFFDGFLSCKVIGRKFSKGAWKPEINNEIDLRIDALGNGEDDFETSYENNYYGSTTIFKLNGNKLNIIDEGFSGGEIITETIELEGESYYWKSEWVNHNNDTETDDLKVKIGMSVLSTVLQTDYSDLYKDMVVSPFPVIGKRLIFTRNAEEGSIFYIDNSNKDVPLTYQMDPYYLYHNGVDLQNEAGSSIFSLNYGYTKVYLINGLVKLGINRNNGNMVLGKWNPELKEYVSQYTFALNNFDDVRINSISDDRIELQASNTIITMYRGHPYVVFKHSNEDINILSRFRRVFAESVGDDAPQPFPTYYDLQNNSNLLPSCASGKNIKSSCLTVDEIYSDLDLVSIGIECITEYPLAFAPIQFRVNSDDLSEGDEVTFFVNGIETGTTTYPTPWEYTFENPDVYQIMAVYKGDDNKLFALSDVLNLNVGQYGDENTPSPSDPDPQLTGYYKLEAVQKPTSFKYRDGKEVSFRLTRGGTPVKGKIVEMIDFNHINTAETDANGMVSFTNIRTDSYPDVYNLGAVFYDYDDEDDNKKYKYKVTWKATLHKEATSLRLLQKAETPGKSFVFKLEDSKGRDLSNKDITVVVNKEKYPRKTNDNGNFHGKLKNKKTYTYYVLYEGNKLYKGCKSETYTETLK